jgi:hypothetical protein
MATLVLNDASVVINSVDLSDHVKSVSIDYESETQDNTAMGDDTRSMQGGLKNWSMSVEFHQDYAAGEVDATIFPIIGSAVPIVVKATSGAVSATNPSYSSYGMVNKYTPIGGGVGDLAATPIEIVPAKSGANASTLVRATS